MYQTFYLLLVTPIAFVVRMFGYDPLRLKKGPMPTAFIDRDHVYTKADFEST